MTSREEKDAERREEARRTLARAERESETVLRAAFEGASKTREEEDPIERMGRRIGRGAGAVFAIGLAIL